MKALALASSVLLTALVLGFFQQMECYRPTEWSEDKTIFERAKIWIRHHPTKARELATMMTTTLLKNEDDRLLYLSALDDVIVQPLDDSGGCIGCQLLVGLFKIALRQNEWPVVEENLIYYCEFLLVAIDQRIQAKEICGGIIPLQAPHVARAVTTIPIPENLEVCEFLNACLPSTDAYRLPHKRAAPSVGAKKRQPMKPKEATKKKRQRRAAETPFAPNDTIRIVQLTDIHIEKDYATNSLTDCWMPVCCLADKGQGNAGHYGSYQCNIPQRTMELFFEEVRTLAPDFVIFSGDIPPHTMWEESLESQLECTSILTNSLSSIIGGIPVYPCIGNHEMFPTNLLSVSLMPNATGVMLQEFARMWTPLAGFTAEEIATMEEAGYYTKLIGIGNLRIVAMNTLYMYTFNFYNVMNHNDLISDGEVTRLKLKITAILAQARDDNEKVIFVGHHVPGNSDFIVAASHWYQELMANFSDVVVLHVSGHTHTDEFRLFLDDEGNAASMVYVSPSIDIHGYKNPSMRIYYLDKTTYEVLDYEQYYYDVKLVGPGDTVPPPTIVRLYSAKEEYGLTDFSPNSWRDLLDRFRTDPDLLQTHRSHSNANADDFSSYACTDQCVEDYICRMLHSTYDGYEACTTPPTSPPTSGTTITWPIITEYQTTGPAAARRARRLARAVFSDSAPGPLRSALLGLAMVFAAIASVVAGSLVA